MIEHSLEKYVSYNKRDESSQLNCYICKKDVKGYERLMIHFSTHVKGNRDLPKVFCKLCGKESTAGYLRKHMFQHVEGQHKKCPYCEKCFPTYVQLNRHKKIHEEYQKLVCDGMYFFFVVPFHCYRIFLFYFCVHFSLREGIS